MSGTYLNPGGTKLLSGFTQSWRQFQGAGKWLLVVCAILLGTGSARANTYLFSVSASQLLTALASDPDESTSGYFAIFVQPSQVTQSYSYTNVTAPNPPPGAEAWNATTITDPSLGTGTFAQFEKGQTQTQIMLLSNDTNWNSRFSGRVYSDTSTYPFGWGNTGGLIIDEIPTTDTFQFTITTTQLLGSTSALTGKAFSVWDNSGT